MPTKLFALVLLACIAVASLSACGGGASAKFPETITIGKDGLAPILANTELTVGPNRFAFGLQAPDGSLVIDAKVHLTFYDLTAGEEVKRFEMDAVSRVPARDAGIPQQVEHVHADGSRHQHFNVGEEIGVYTAQVVFDRAGRWGVEMQIEANGRKQTIRPSFMVAAQATTPPIGADAPRSRNLTAADVSDIAQIDSSATPSADMHTSTIADAIAAGRPVLVLFAVPGYCTSRLCGPEMEIMRKLFPRYRDRVEFIHVEFYKKPGDPQSEVADAVKEWGLRSEPWFFVIDKQGKIAAKFEGPTSLQELEEALQAVAR
ncbi:MAG TPA: hypothetical protein VNN21_03360 [Dehalococcoidia bacterium]|nr:hypothetical protein [Dehalococcoidia bacterium]